MSLAEIAAIAIGLSMDAFAVSIGKGLASKDIKVRNALSAGIWFGGFQGLMPVIGYYLGRSCQALVESVDHWIAFGLLFLIGANMVREAFSGKEDNSNSSFSARTMFVMAIATSIDALACGISFAFLDYDILPAASFIAATTFVFSFAGIYLGHLAGGKFHKPSQVLGGVILMLIGIKILVEHIFFA